MKFGKVFFLLIAFTLAFSCLETRAQVSKSPKQIKILNNFGAIPFEDGKTIVAEIVFTGLDVNYTQSDEEEEKLLTERKALERLRFDRAAITANEAFYGYKVAKAVKTIREWLVSSGYDKAEVIAFGEKLPKNEMKLIFSINRGALARVSEIVFEGNVNLTNDELVAHLKNCAGDNLEIFDQRKYDYFLRKCSLRFIFSKGYFKGKIDNFNRRLAEDGYIVTVRVQEGVRYRIGEIKIEGVKAFTEKEIREMLGQKEGEIPDGEKLQDFVYEKLKEVYADKGYVLYNGEFDTVYIEPQVEGLDGIVNLVLTIDEGKPFKLSKIEFTGVEKEKIEGLRRLISLKDGEVYNQSKIEEGIKKINETGEFYPIEYDSTAVEVFASIEPETERIEGSLLLRRKDIDNEGIISLVIKLQKIEQ